MNPLRRARCREVAVVAVGVCAVALAAAWALRPLPSAQHEAPDLSAPDAGITLDDQIPPLNLAAFQAPIWNPRPDPTGPAVAETATAEPPAPLRLQLVAIVRDGEELLAALYDPDANELRLARVGETVGRHTVTLVDATGVELGQLGAFADPHRVELIPPGGPR